MQLDKSKEINAIEERVVMMNNFAVFCKNNKYFEEAIRINLEVIGNTNLVLVY